MAFGGTEAANLFVRVTGDISDATSKMDKVGKSVEKTGGVLKGALSTAIGFGAASIGLSAFGSAMGAIKGGAIDMNAELETSTLQFETLMGSSDKARQHVEDLFDFAAKTPFESGPIIKASRTMRTFGGDSLDTKENLKLFGDAAAAVSQPIDDVSFWMSRAYAAIQGGQPFGEARMRLMEMGVITPQVAAKMEKLQKSGASSTKVWGEMTGALGRFDGAMDKQAGTFSGMMSTLTDNVNMMLAKAGKPLFDMLKGVLGGLNDMMSSPAFTGALEAAAKGIGAAFSILGDALKAVWDFAQPIIGAIGSIVDVLLSGEDVASGLDETLGNLGEQFSNLGQQIWTGLLSFLTDIAPKMQEFGQSIVDGLLDMVDPAVEAIGTVGQGIFDWIINEGVPQFAAAMAPMAEQGIKWLTTDLLPRLGTELPKIGEAILSFLEKNLPVIIGKLGEWAMAFVKWVIPMIPPLLLALAKLLVAVGGWILTQALPRLLALAGELGLGFVKGLLKFIVGPPGILQRIAEFITGVLIPGLIKYVPRLVDAAGKMAKGFVDGFIDFLKSLPGKVADMVRRAFQGLNINIGPFHISSSGVTVDLPKIDVPHFATGSWSVPYTGPAVVHKGEMIIPADLASRLRGGQLGGGSALQGVSGNGPIVINMPISAFYGTEENIRTLSEELGKAVRYSTLRRNPGG